MKKKILKISALVLAILLIAGVCLMEKISDVEV